MTMGDRIKNYRLAAGLTQGELATRCEVAEITIRQYESGKRQPRIEQLEKISSILKISIADLLGAVQHNEYFWTAYLDDKLKQIGCWISHDEDNAMTWIEFPDGTLEVDEDDLKELDNSTISYLQFKLEELKKKHPEDFRPRRKK